MLIVMVNVHVKADFVEPFKAASVDNAKNSLKEPGVARFDVIQQADDPTRFVLIEVYRSEQAPASHRETDHYQRWKEAAEPMMAEPRTRLQFHGVFPDEAGWG